MLSQKLQNLKAKLDAKLAEKQFLTKECAAIDSEISALSRNLMNYDKAASFCDVLIEKLNKASVSDIENLVSEALQYIFDKPYKFKMIPTVLRGNVTYNFALEIDGHEEDNIMEAQGGGVISVISVLMRIVTVLISQPPMKRVLFLDESLGMLSAEYIDNASKFIKELGAKLGFTIVLVTHQEAFKQHADAIYEVEKGTTRRLK